MLGRLLISAAKLASIAFKSSLENGPCCTDVPGNHKIKVLQGFVQFIKDLHAMCSTNKASIVAWGVSRGARWLEEIVRKRSVYLDVAVAKWSSLTKRGAPSGAGSLKTRSSSAL